MTDTQACLDRGEHVITTRHRRDVCPAEDVTRLKAERLVNACNGLGLQARLHWDRSPWCCQVALVDTTAADFDENTPRIFWMLEDGGSYYIRDTWGRQVGWMWHAQMQLDRNIEEQDDIYDLGFEIPERTEQGDDEHEVARKIAMLVSMLDVSGIVVG